MNQRTARRDACLWPPAGAALRAGRHVNQDKASPTVWPLVMAARRGRITTSAEDDRSDRPETGTARTDSLSRIQDPRHLVRPRATGLRDHRAGLMPIEPRKTGGKAQLAVDIQIHCERVLPGRLFETGWSTKHKRRKSPCLAERTSRQ